MPFATSKIPAFLALSLIFLAGPSYQILLQCRNPAIQLAVSAVAGMAANDSSTSLAVNNVNDWPPCNQQLIDYYQGALDQCLMIDTSNATVSCQQCTGDQLINTLCQSKLNTVTPCSVCMDPYIAQKSSCYNPRQLTEAPVLGMPVCGEFLWKNYGNVFENCAIANNLEGPGCRECSWGYQLNQQCNSLFTLVNDKKRCAVCDPLPADKVERMPFSFESSGASSSSVSSSLFSLFL